MVCCVLYCFRCRIAIACQSWNLFERILIKHNQWKEKNEGLLNRGNEKNAPKFHLIGMGNTHASFLFENHNNNNNNNEYICKTITNNDIFLENTESQRTISNIIAGFFVFGKIKQSLQIYHFMYSHSIDSHWYAFVFVFLFVFLQYWSVKNFLFEKMLKTTEK